MGQTTILVASRPRWRWTALLLVAAAGSVAVAAWPTGGPSPRAAHPPTVLTPCRQARPAPPPPPVAPDECQPRLTAYATSRHAHAGHAPALTREHALDACIVRR